MNLVAVLLAVSVLAGFAPRFTVLMTANEPKPEYRWADLGPGMCDKYNVVFWPSSTLTKREPLPIEHVSDGFDPTKNIAANADRVFDAFRAAPAVSVTGDADWKFSDAPRSNLCVSLEGDLLRARFTPKTVRNAAGKAPPTLFAPILGGALVTDGERIFERRVKPLLEALLPRQNFLLGLAKTWHGKTCALNLDDAVPDNIWQNVPARYRAAGDAAWLEKANAGADTCLCGRIVTAQTSFRDEAEHGMFFWTGSASRWMELYELFTETGKKRYLETACQGARRFPFEFSVSLPTNTIGFEFAVEVMRSNGKTAASEIRRLCA